MSAPHPEPAADPLTLGTAGHVDHGKTALVHALTGVETDRLPEERARGLTIVLGYAPLALPGGRQLSVVDVPGHERFVRTMVAGATGVDGFLLVVAADDGVMPQTREHAAVLRALGIGAGVVAVTKADLADPARAATEAAALVPGCEAVAVSARTGAGLEELRGALGRLAGRLVSRAAAADAAPLLHVDRVFTVAGRGTVVTGTLWAGALAVGDGLHVLPAGLPVRVRGLEVHGAQRERARAGQRVAVNLVGTRPQAVARGDVLGARGVVAASSVLDCALALDGAADGERVHVHHGTREAPGRLVALGGDLFQLRLDRPLLAADGDRVVVRRSSPPATLGGGVVLDAAARRHGRRAEVLAALAVRRDGGGGAPSSAGSRGRCDGAAGAGAAGAAGAAGDGGVHGDAGARSSAGGRATRDGAAAGARAAPSSVVGRGTRDPALAAAADALEAELLAAGHAMLPEAAADPRALRALRADGRAVRVAGRSYAHAMVVQSVRETALRIIDAEGDVTLPRLRDALGASRKVAQAFLEHLDEERVTRRLPDDRRVRRQPAAA